MGGIMKRYIKFLVCIVILSSGRDAWSMRSGIKSSAPLFQSAEVGLRAYEPKSEPSNSQATSDSTGSYGYHPSVVGAKTMQPSPGVLSSLPEYSTVPSRSLLKGKNGRLQKGDLHGSQVDYNLVKRAMDGQAKPVGSVYQQFAIRQPNVVSDGVMSDVHTSTAPVDKNQYSKPFNFGEGTANPPVGGFLGGSLGGSAAYRRSLGQSKLVEQKQPAKISEQQTVEQSQPALLMLTYDPEFAAQKAAKVSKQQEQTQNQSDQQVVVATPTQKQVQDELFHNYFTGRQADNFSQPNFNSYIMPVDATLLQSKQAAPLLLTYDYTLSTPEPTKIGEQQNNLQPVENQPVVESQQAQQAVAPENVMPESAAQLLSNSNLNRPIINARQRRSPKKVSQFEVEKKDLSDSKIIPDLHWKIEVEYENYTQDPSSWAIVRMVSRLKNWILEKLDYRPSAAQKNLIDTKVQKLATEMNNQTVTEANFYDEIEKLLAEIQEIQITGMSVRGSLVDQNNVNSSDFAADFVA